MSGKSKAVLALLLVVGVLAAAFLWLDFQAVRSESRANSQVATASAKPEGTQESGPAGELSLHVQGNDGLTVALRQELATLLRAGPAFTGVKIVDALPAGTGGPALMVEVAERDVLWTPVHGQGHLLVKATYASDGDLSWRGETVMRMQTGEPLRRVRGEFQIEDATNGVISLKAYDRHLGRYAATEVSKSIQRAARGG